jgi:hypothetical protein
VYQPAQPCTKESTIIADRKCIVDIVFKLNAPLVAHVYEGGVLNINAAANVAEVPLKKHGRINQLLLELDRRGEIKEFEKQGGGSFSDSGVLPEFKSWLHELPFTDRVFVEEDNWREGFRMDRTSTYNSNAS